MYVVVYHQFKNPPEAFARGEKLIKNEDAPPGVRGLQFYPSRAGTAATCLWEAGSVEDVQGYVDSTLGDSSVNTCWEVNAEMAFAERPLRDQDSCQGVTPERAGAQRPDRSAVVVLIRPGGQQGRNRPDAR